MRPFTLLTLVERVVCLRRQKVDEHIYFDVNVQDLPKTARTTATYPEIKEYVKEKYGLNVTSLNIVQVKEKHGFEKRENYNKGKDGHRVPNCPPEKEKAIEDAFKALWNALNWPRIVFKRLGGVIPYKEQNTA